MDKRKTIENIYPLSPMQQGILFHTLLAPEAGVYVPQILLTLTGELNVAALKQAWQQAVTCHDVLRTGFYWEQRDDPFQVVYRQAELPWVQQDWRWSSTGLRPSHPPDLQSTRLQIFLDCNQTQSFDLHTPPLMRLALVQVCDHKYHLIWAYHHLILDGWSAANLLKTVFTYYFSIIGHPNENASTTSTHPPIPPSPPYTTYLTWLQSQDRTAAQTFWQSYLQGFQGPTTLPFNSSPIHSQSHQAEQRLLSAEQTGQLRLFAQQHQLTLNTLIQGAFGLLLSRYCDTVDVLFGATYAGRPPSLPGSEAMVGLFINTLPVRVQVPADASVIPWLQQLQQDRAATSAYEYSALMDVQGWSELPAGQPLFDCLLVVENYPVDAALLSEQSSLTLEDVRFIEWTHFPLTLLVLAGETLSLTAKYNRNRVADDAISRMLAHLETLLVGLVTHAHGSLGNLPLLTSAEQEQIRLWNQTETAYPLDRCLPDWIELQVEQTPDAVALSFKDETLTYRNLNSKANQLAHHLQSLGVGPEVPVAVCVERSLDMIIALLGILKAGGTYLPLDPSYPRDRLAWMLDDAAPAVLIIHAATDSLQADLPSEPKRLNLTTDQPHLQRHPISLPPHRLVPNNSIYILYTSGSTGRPKGVINTHRGLVNRLCWMQDAYPVTPSDRVLQKTPLSFDVSGWELFWPLITGACLVLARPEGHKDSAYLVELIQQQAITTLHFVPAMLSAFLESPNVAQCSSLKRVFCSGEALATSLQTQFFQALPTVELHNLYGPTEAAIDVTAWDCRQSYGSSPTATVPIGRPIANTQIYLLDSQGQLVPPGIPGELHIGGVGLARGYLNRPDLTSERFMPNPSAPNSMVLYKTGDRACYHPDGTLEFLGRMDHQVKLRGFRIELGEIEAVLSQHPDVSQAVVVLREDEAKEPQLVAYIVAKAEGKKSVGAWEELTHPSPVPTFGEASAFGPSVSAELNVEASSRGVEPLSAHVEAYPPISPSAHLVTYLAKHLPAYMIPTTFVGLDALPLLPNGKVDRKALPAAGQPMQQKLVPPRTPTEARIAAMWQETLQLEKVGIDNNFFELGGNSLSATRVNTRLRKAFELDVGLRAIFEYPTIAQLAVHINAMQMTLNQPVAKTTGRKEIEL